MKNALTINLEDWFQSSSFEGVIKYKEWGSCEPRIKYTTQRLLAILNERGVRATFFVLGWTAKKFPDLVKEIKNRGHEIASFGYAHKPIYRQTKEKFYKDVERSINILAEITGEKISGYRAPNFSLMEETLWAYESLVDLGLRYDSSVFPVRNNSYGYPKAPRFPYLIETKKGGQLLEIPLTTYPIMDKNIPIAGGGYLRLYPYWFIKKGIKKVNSQGKPAIIYLRSWELDPSPPKVKAKFFNKFRHYANLDLMENKVKSLLKDFEFAPIREVFNISDRSGKKFRFLI